MSNSTEPVSIVRVGGGDEGQALPFVSEELYNHLAHIFDIRHIVLSTHPSVTLDRLRGQQEVLDYIKILTPKEVQ